MPMLTRGMSHKKVDLLSYTDCKLVDLKEKFVKK